METVRWIIPKPLTSHELLFEHPRIGEKNFIYEEIHSHNFIMFTQQEVILRN